MEEKTTPPASEITAEMRPRNTSNTLIIALLVLLIGLVIGGASGYYFGRKSDSMKTTTQSEDAIIPVTTSPAMEEMKGLDFTATYPQGFSVLSDTGEVRTLGFDGVTYLTFSLKNTITVDSLPSCESENVFPCLDVGKNWGADADIISLQVGGKPAKSFYLLTGTVDSAEHVVQVPGEFEARMNVAGGGLDQKFKEMLQTVVFRSASATFTHKSLYQNQDFKIAFSIAENERVIECPSKSETSDNVGLWVSNTVLPEGVDPQIECQSEGPYDAVFMNKNVGSTSSILGTISLLEGPNYGYSLTKTPITVSGISGTRITGQRDTSIPAPLAASIDQLLFEKDNVFYQIPATYIERDFTFLK